MRLMRARMTRGTAVVMGVTSRPVQSVASHRRGRLHPAAGPPPEAPHARRGFRCATWPLATRNRWIWPSIIANQPLAMPAHTRQGSASN
jgi:hypothetical protein